MAIFLNTTATSYHLEELMKNSSKQLILISPFLKLSNRLKIDVRIVYGKSVLQPDQVNWFKELLSIRTSYCENLHAKCYLNEESCIITSMNLYEFSQVNNNEIGVFISRSEDPDLYNDAYEEAQHIIRISDEVRMSLEKVPSQAEDLTPENPKINGVQKLSSSKLAKKLNLKTDELLTKLVDQGYLEIKQDKHYLTEAGKSAGGEFRTGRYGPFFLWPEALETD